MLNRNSMQLSQPHLLLKLGHQQSGILLRPLVLRLATWNCNLTTATPQRHSNYNELVLLLFFCRFIRSSRHSRNKIPFNNLPWLSDKRDVWTSGFKIFQSFLRRDHSPDSRKSGFASLSAEFLLARAHITITQRRLIRSSTKSEAN